MQGCLLPSERDRNAVRAGPVHVVAPKRSASIGPGNPARARAARFSPARPGSPTDCAHVFHSPRPRMPCGARLSAQPTTTRGSNPPEPAVALLSSEHPAPDIFRDSSDSARTARSPMASCPLAPTDASAPSAASSSPTGLDADPNPGSRPRAATFGLVRVRHALPWVVRPDSDPVPPSSANDARRVRSGRRSAPSIEFRERTELLRVRLEPFRTAGGGCERLAPTSARRGA